MKAPKKRINSDTVNRIIGFIGSVSSAACLMFTLNTLGNNGLIFSLDVNFLVVFSLLALSKLIQAVMSKNNGDRVGFIKDLCFAAVFAIAGTVPLWHGLDLIGMKILFTSFYATILVNRVIITVQDHRARKIVFNGIVFVIAAYLTLFTVLCPEDQMYLMYMFNVLAIAFTALNRIILISFSRMRLKVMRKILKKTYAAEILSGLALLIVSFSFVFYTFEESLSSYPDALWYCFAVITTIGFGDFTVTAPLSRLLSVILGIYGIVVVALITSVIVNFYNEIKNSPDDGEKDTEPEKKRKQ